MDQNVIYKALKCLDGGDIIQPFPPQIGVCCSANYYMTCGDSSSVDNYNKVWLLLRPCDICLSMPFCQPYLLGTLRLDVSLITDPYGAWCLVSNK